MSAQIIEHNGHPAFAVVPIAEWTELQARLESLQDIADAKSTRDTATFTAEFTDRPLAGESPLKAWRAYRGLTLHTLAERCGVTRQLPSMVEPAKANASTALPRNLAASLGGAMDDLHA